MSFEEDIADNKCEGCPVLDKCPIWIEHMGKKCKKLLEDNGEIWES